jgi:hypothetical protein
VTKAGGDRRGPLGVAGTAAAARLGLFTAAMLTSSTSSSLSGSAVAAKGCRATAVG